MRKDQEQRIRVRLSERKLAGQTVLPIVKESKLAGETYFVHLRKRNTYGIMVEVEGLVEGQPRPCFSVGYSRDANVDSDGHIVDLENKTYSFVAHPPKGWVYAPSWIDIPENEGFKAAKIIVKDGDEGRMSFGLIVKGPGIGKDTIGSTTVCAPVGDDEPYAHAADGVGRITPPALAEVSASIAKEAERDEAEVVLSTSEQVDEALWKGCVPSFLYNEEICLPKNRLLAYRKAKLLAGETVPVSVEEALLKIALAEGESSEDNEGLGSSGDGCVTVAGAVRDSIPVCGALPFVEDQVFVGKEVSSADFAPVALRGVPDLSFVARDCSFTGSPPDLRRFERVILEDCEFVDIEEGELFLLVGSSSTVWKGLTFKVLFELGDDDDDDDYKDEEVEDLEPEFDADDVENWSEEDKNRLVRRWQELGRGSRKEAAMLAKIGDQEDALKKKRRRLIRPFLIGFLCIFSVFVYHLIASNL